MDNSDVIMAILIPYAVERSEFVELLEEISSIVQTDLQSALSSAFLTIYTYSHLFEDERTAGACLQFIIDGTESTLFDLLKSDVQVSSPCSDQFRRFIKLHIFIIDFQKTTAEVLVYYHAKPDFVMQTFRTIIGRSSIGGTSSSRSDFSTQTLADYIQSRFLGVICHFEQILISDNEKALKRNVLLSLGEIMRFMGSRHMTQFRFKLLAVLRTALSINQDFLTDICVQVWKIFVNTIDLMQLGPLLSTIFVSLEPLFSTHADEVNEILKYLIIANGNLLSVHIADLFFVKDTMVCSQIKQQVEQFSANTSDSLMTKLEASLRNISHDNLTVRIYGLNYLTELIDENRLGVNNLIIGQQHLQPIIEKLLEVLIVGMKNPDELLKIATARCLGKLGALEPSLLSPNYGPEKSFARGVDTDEFAIMALAELCMAYQLQKDTKNVDGYSLAIQEILVDRGVCPKSGKNMKVWEAIPNRMKPLMEPLLTSFYTMTHAILDQHNVHPIFGSQYSSSHVHWAREWTAKIIEMNQDETTKNLLRSFKPCMRFDMRMLSRFLPYIMIHALQNSDDVDRNEIFEEIIVVSEAVINPNMNVVGSSTNREPMKSVRDIDFVVSANATVAKVKEESDDIGIKCAKLAFNQLDFIDQWIRNTETTDPKHRVVKKFIDQFDKKLIASANFACGEYARALMYLESYIEGNRKDRFQTELPFLFQIHAELMDPDSLEGVLKMKDKEASLVEQIMKNNVQGRLQESAACFERMLHENQMSDINCVDMVQCYLGLEEPETAMLLIDGLMKRLFDQNNDALLLSSAEPLWRLGRFEELQELIENSNFEDRNDWGVRCGQTLLKFRQNSDDFTAELDTSRLAVLRNLRIVGDEQNPYEKGYSHIMKLHMISEIEQAQDAMKDVLRDENRSSATFERLFGDWELRLSLLQPTARIVEPVLCLRRIVMSEVRDHLKRKLKSQETLRKDVEQIINNYIGNSWIKSTEYARESGLFQQAELYIMSAETFKPTLLFIEKAKILWQKGNQSSCFKELERGIHLLEAKAIKTSEEKTALGDAKFLKAYYNGASLNINAELNIKYFREAKSILETEKCLVHYAQYLDKALTMLTGTTADDGATNYKPKAYDYRLEIMYMYCKSMQYGTNYIYQSMPRVLSIWFDFTASIVDRSTTPRAQLEHFVRVSRKMNDVIEKFLNLLPAFIFFTAFSQLVSRICHPSNDVYNVLKSIIIKLIIAFPQQSLWMILCVYKSSLASRVRKCTEIFSDKRLQGESLQKLIQDFNSLAEKMIELTNKELPKKITKFSIKQIFPQLPALLSRSNFSKIIIPIEKYMQPVLPSLHQRNEPALKFNAFPNQAVYIVGIRDELTQLPSLQRPRRVTLRGSDGNDYIIMMKPKDDLRKDFRLMEFNSVVKKYLHQNPEARQRRLNIRTYSVTPLNEECGILEWVQNLHQFRHIVMGKFDLYPLKIPLLITFFFFNRLLQAKARWYLNG